MMIADHRLQKETTLDKTIDIDAVSYTHLRAHET